ncbi:hypothetical protein BBK36DRAFT_3612 [Trichoderma citrinoviride]|uniref:Uncharacterized protein n=1 Tax=Trichoderma citrinoviride TaxID=58853 RepID=A0A2T4BE39_9HYPO|nr:hypothetical protein BBK36DRAFT_3612 [Trichoderma citrinoviride]PTB67603.1 hypothetical protein BBK36DRAFT_3612 [Trichoderma citrinoviride]
MPFSFPLWALDDTTPWQLPVPFVGPVLRTFGGLLLLANVNALYERMGIFGYQKAFPIYALNLVLIGLVFLAISVFCSRRLANYYHDWVTVGTTLTVTILWVVIFALNMGIVIAGFVRCNVRHLRKNSPLDSGSYCHFFGNPELAEKSGWDGKAWPAYYWANLALFLMVAFWQLLNWYQWFRRVLPIVRNRRRQEARQARIDEQREAARIELQRQERRLWRHRQQQRMLRDLPPPTPAAIAASHYELV